MSDTASPGSEVMPSGRERHSDTSVAKGEKGSVEREFKQLALPNHELLCLAACDAKLRTKQLKSMPALVTSQPDQEHAEDRHGQARECHVMPVFVHASDVQSSFVQATRLATASSAGNTARCL